MEKLQKQFHGQTDNLSKLDLRVHSLETVGSPSDASEPAGVGLKQLGCQFSPASPWAKGSKIVLCAQGSPPLFYQRAGDEVRPVSSLSPVGFQDVSISARPACGAASWGTCYVEKGAGRGAEKRSLAARKSDGRLRVGPAGRCTVTGGRGVEFAIWAGCGSNVLGKIAPGLDRHGAVALLAGVGASGAAIGGGLLLASWVGCSGFGFLLVAVAHGCWRWSGRVSWRQLQPSAVHFPVPPVWVGTRCPQLQDGHWRPAVGLCVGHGSIVSLGPVVSRCFAASGRDGALCVPGLFPAHENPGHVPLAGGFECNRLFSPATPSTKS